MPVRIVYPKPAIGARGAVAGSFGGAQKRVTSSVASDDGTFQECQLGDGHKNNPLNQETLILFMQLE